MFIAFLLSPAPSSAFAQTNRDLSSCRASRLHRFIGKPYPLLQSLRPDARFVCRGCPMTMDFRADRLIVTYDPKSKRVLALRCV